MNYINTPYLENEVQELTDSLDAANRLVSELMVYLQSPKFHSDTTVQTKDVLDRLSAIRMELSS